MTRADFLEKRKVFIELIERRATGTPTELANMLHINERALFRFLNDIRSEGLEFKYCRTIRSYSFETDCK